MNLPALSCAALFPPPAPPLIYTHSGVSAFLYFDGFGGCVSPPEVNNTNKFFFLFYICTSQETRIRRKNELTNIQNFQQRISWFSHR